MTGLTNGAPLNVVGLKAILRKADVCEEILNRNSRIAIASVNNIRFSLARSVVII